MTPPQPRRPTRTGRSFRPRLRYLILAVLTLPIIFGFGTLLLIILLGSHTTESSETPSRTPTPTVSLPTTPSPIPSPHSCFPFQPNC